MHALAPIAYIADMKSPLFRTLVLFLDFFTVRKTAVMQLMIILFVVMWFHTITHRTHTMVLTNKFHFATVRPPHACCASPNSCRIRNSSLTTVSWCVMTMPWLRKFAPIYCFWSLVTTRNNWIRWVKNHTSKYKFISCFFLFDFYVEHFLLRCMCSIRRQKIKCFT